jgi:hypothetical protein
VWQSLAHWGTERFFMTGEKKSCMLFCLFVCLFVVYLVLVGDRVYSVQFEKSSILEDSDLTLGSEEPTVRGHIAFLLICKCENSHGKKVPG